MKDLTLETSAYLPAAGATNYTPPIPFPLDAGGFSNAWRLGRIKATIPACPNNVTAADVITLTLQDSADGVTFADCNPLIQWQLPGVASTGSAAVTASLPLIPNLRGGGIRFRQTCAAGTGNNVGIQIVYDLVNE